MKHSKCERIIRKHYLKVTIISLAILLILNICQSIQISRIKVQMKELPSQTYSGTEPNEIVTTPVLTNLGEYTITAYCACKKCCGEWASNRPNGIVKGAAGVELTNGVSCASNEFEFGTKLSIEGYGEVIVQDRTANWVNDKYGGKIIDIYFNDHNEAFKFGKQTAEVSSLGS